jgi:DNA-binding transcriptional MerR regulator
MASQAERLGLGMLGRYSTTPVFNTKAVVRQTGIPAPTLRAWERRYGILAPQRGSNDYRLYSEQDIALVAWLRQQVENGLNISQAIALLRSVHSPQEEDVQSPGRTSPADQPAPAPLHLQQNGVKAAGEAPGNVPGQLSALVDEFLSACARLDETAAQRVLASIFALFSVEQAITDVLHPLMITIGERWQARQLSVTTEHFAVTLIYSRLAALFHAQPVPSSGPLVLVGCAPGEQHELGALILALLLRRQSAGLRVIYLGQSLEPGHLLETIQIQRPAVVCLSASLPEHRPAVGDIARRISALPPLHRPLLIYGGRAFTQEAPDIEGVFLGTHATQAVAPIERFCAAHTLVLS